VLRRVIVLELSAGHVAVLVLSDAVYNSSEPKMRIRVMTKRDIPSGLRLSALAGWNQTPDDWHRFLSQSSDGCFVMEDGSKIVGTATTIIYEDRFAWIGMVLVDPECRKQGIGTQLLNKTIEYLDQSQIGTMKLDATPLGKPIYAKLGFVNEYEIERWILKRTSPATDSSLSHRSTSLLTPMHLDQISKLDKQIFGADRSFLLRSLHEQCPQFSMAVWADGLPQGYCFGRRGLFADHFGPWIASNPSAAEYLLQGFLRQSLRDTLIVDCLKSNSWTLELLNASGFVTVRPLTRMVRGANPYPGQPGSLCAILGPEFG
jgi:GNAT superfamily N-acetyltransferase